MCGIAGCVGKIPNPEQIANTMKLAIVSIEDKRFAEHNGVDWQGTLTGLSREAGLADERGTFPRLRSALLVEGAGAVVGGATSSSSATVFIGSGAGVEEGARTGLANLVTGVLFLAAMFVSPLASIVPTEVAAAALLGGETILPPKDYPISVAKGEIRMTNATAKSGDLSVDLDDVEAKIPARYRGSTCWWR